MRADYLSLIIFRYPERIRDVAKLLIFAGKKYMAFRMFKQAGFLSLGFLVAFVSAAGMSSAAESATQYAPPTVCEIRGTVSSLEHVNTANIPSAFSGSETHISVNIEQRAPRYHQAADKAPCPALTPEKLQTYKLCSPTRVKAGDKIHGTEGINTGPAASVGCLFDLIVLSRK